MDFSVHEQRTLARMEQDLSGDRRLSSLMALLDSKRSRRIRTLKSAVCRLSHPREDMGPVPGYHVPDTRPLLALTILLTIACVAVFVTSLVLGIATMIVVASVVLPLPPALGLVIYLRLRRHR
ncbi:MAG TPA: hypothetical protein VHV49_19450 [Pseudonocardiaceae bacterium]|jgi:Flp pilus assembly protein TadB|nr:hypothetical protein [Pseudonocardiaceae bacterium]